MPTSCGHLHEQAPEGDAMTVPPVTRKVVGALMLSIPLGAILSIAVWLAWTSGAWPLLVWMFIGVPVITVLVVYGGSLLFDE